ncbi:branched-chain amino acid ABC transporter permease [Pseudorhodoferax aquiterrae]|uniref:Branched-chain amino acid ABC transporter permease n=1 Tax=Pseudorhodoferax aquiterrae TaxID=747304 RepID=A0ABQ3FV33_9BURK|nr:branched-chain amino acid ABC transporter permease [Pseudorhodoferax aquiterrae]GHC69556.1 branched-chain amino acid ABC transporter permease [Pseudorhodoferax aquiterrae]
MQASTFAGAHPRRDALVLLLVMGAALLAPAFLNRGLVFIAGMVWINAVFGLAFNLLFGLSGVLSFGQAMFFAAGAYATALLTQGSGLPFLLVLPLSALVGAVLAAAVGVVALRRSEGVYFAILTLAFAELLHLLIANTGALGRNDGLAGLARPVLALGGWRIDLAAGDNFYYCIVAICGGLIAFVRWLIGTSFGRALQAVKQDPERAEFLGIPVRRHRLAIFVLAGAVTATAGALVAPWAQIVTPELAHWSNSTNPILYTLLGGSAYFWGPVLGAFVLSCVFYVTRTLVGLSDMVTGLLLLVVVVGLPGGILGLLARLTQRGDRR